MVEELELPPDSPYASGYVVDYGDGTYTLETDALNYAKEIGDEYLDVVEGDTLDTLAFNRYGNSKLWHIIATANSIINPFEPLEAGLTLRIPNPEKWKMLT